MFSFLEEDQPTEQIKVLLGEVDNGQVSSMVITDPGGGYTGAVPKVSCARGIAAQPLRQSLLSPRWGGAGEGVLICCCR